MWIRIDLKQLHFVCYTLTVQQNIHKITNLQAARLQESNKLTNFRKFDTYTLCKVCGPGILRRSRGRLQSGSQSVGQSFTQSVSDELTMLRARLHLFLIIWYQPRRTGSAARRVGDLGRGLPPGIPGNYRAMQCILARLWTLIWSHRGYEKRSPPSTKPTSLAMLVRELLLESERS